MTLSWTSPTSASAIYLILALVMSFSIICFGREDDSRSQQAVGAQGGKVSGRLRSYLGDDQARVRGVRDQPRGRVRHPGQVHGRADRVPATESGTFKKFGCTFENKDYLVRTDSVFNAKYGEKVAPMEFKSSEDFEEMLGEIKTIYTQTLGELVYNNVPAFLDFYDAYKSNFTGDFDAFYRAYIPKFLPGHVCTSMAVTLLDNLIEEIPDIKDHCHLITSEPDANNKLLEMVNVDENIDGRSDSERDYTTQRGSIRPPKFKFSHGHVVALLRIKLPNRRLGFVLMDLGLGLSNPVVLMMDEKSPHQAYSVGSGRRAKGEEYRFWISNQDYAIALTYPDKYVHERHLYYIGEPYCSFLLTTNKANVFLPSRIIIRKSETSAIIAFLNFNVNAKPPKFTITRVVPGTETAAIKIDKDDILFRTRNQMNQTTKSAYNEVIAKLNVPNIEDMLTKAEEITKDSDFLHYIAKLSNDIDQYKSDPEVEQRQKELAERYSLKEARGFYKFSKENEPYQNKAWTNTPKY